jgi:hypothetical protein
MSGKAFITEQLANVAMVSLQLPWNGALVPIRCTKTLEGSEFACILDIASVMMGEKAKNVAPAVNKMLKKLNVKYDGDFKAAVLKVN